MNDSEYVRRDDLGFPDLFKMKCGNPRQVWRDEGLKVYACTRCTACLVKYRAAWARRIDAEVEHQARQGRGTVFATLTFSPEGLEKHGDAPSVEAIQAFNKAFRKAYQKAHGLAGVRYALVSERGEQHGRLHYHAVYFGVDKWSALQLMQKAWPYGRVDLEDLRGSGDYVMKYVRKQAGIFMMSRRPGIGRAKAEALAAHPGTRHYVATHGDVPHVLEAHKPGQGCVKRVPVGRYVRSVMRQAHGLADKVTSAVGRAGLEWQAEELNKLHRMAKYRRQDRERLVRRAVIDAQAVERIEYYDKHPRSRWSQGREPARLLTAGGLVANTGGRR